MSEITIDTHGNQQLEAEAHRLNLRNDLSYDVRIRPVGPMINSVTISTYDDKGLLCQREREVPVFTDAEIAEAVAEMIRHRRVSKDAVLGVLGAL